MAAAHRVAGAAPERQGAGAVDAGRAVTLALADGHSKQADFASSPRLTRATVDFLIHDHRARVVSVVGGWDGWKRPGLPARELEPGLWRASFPRPLPGKHHYKLLLDDTVWMADPSNPQRAHDGDGGWNSVLVS
jgi:hypothetical protein